MHAPFYDKRVNISVILNAHQNTELVQDTVESIKANVSNDILMITDFLHWKWATSFNANIKKMRVHPHGPFPGPYRNVVMGLQQASELWDSDWYCYTEYDVLFTSNYFKKILSDNDDVWCYGNDLRTYNLDLPLLEYIVGTKFKETKYLLGCCMFFNRKFIQKLKEIDFFNRFLFFTNPFTEGFFPNFKGYDFGEHLFPTLANHWGTVKQFACWKDNMQLWTGDYKKFPMRWKPDISDDFQEASIIHPIKSYDHPIRKYFRTKR